MATNEHQPTISEKGRQYNELKDLDLGEIALIDNRWTDAEAHLRRCLEIAPDHQKGRYDLDFATRREVPPHLIGLTDTR